MQKPTFKNKSFTRKQAFTLIELLIVIAIIGILFIVLVSKVDFATDKAKATGVQTDFRSFQMAFETVSRENAGFNTFGWDTGDLNANGKRDSYDEGDTNKDGKQDAGEVWTGHKVYAETFTKVFSLVKPGTTGYNRESLNNLETAINANLDPKLHITIKDDGEIVMANGAKDPWNKEYHGWYITNAEVDKKDRGAIVMYSDGANNEFGSEHTIASGIVVINVPGNNKNGKDDYGMATVYTYTNGYGEIKTSTSGFSNNPTGGNNGSVDVENDNNLGGGDEEEVGLLAGLYDANGEMLATWEELVNDYGLNIYTDYTSDTTDPAHPATIIKNNFPSAYKVVIEGNGRIGNKAFAGTTVTEVIIKEGITELGTSFCNTTSLRKVEFPSSLKVIGEWCFNSADNLNEVVFKEGLEEIKEGAFCISSLVNVELPLSCKILGERSFAYLSTLTTIKGNGVETIGSNAFIQTGLTSTEFNNVKDIGQGAFASSKLTHFNFPEGLTSLGHQAFQYTKLTEVNLPSTLTFIGRGAFEGTYIEFLYIPDSVVDMYSPTFWSGYALKVVSLPNSNFNTNSSVIVGESTVEIVIIRNTSKVLDANMFATDYIKNWVTYVPDELVDAYRNNADYIKYNANIQPLSSCPHEYLK